MKQNWEKEFDKKFEYLNRFFKYNSKDNNPVIELKDFISETIKEIKQEERKRIRKRIEKIEIASKFMNTIDRDKVLEILNK